LYFIDCRKSTRRPIWC